MTQTKSVLEAFKEHVPTDEELVEWLAERDQPPIGKTCPKNWSTAPCRTP